MGAWAKRRAVLALPTLALALALAAEPVERFEAQGGWEDASTRDGVTVDRRAIAGTPYFEYRASTLVDVPADALCEHVFTWGTLSRDHAGMKLRRLVRDSGDERVTYDQIEQPIVANRDFGMTVRRFRDAAGVCRIRFFQNNAEAPPSPPGFVRMTKLWGSWAFEPDGEKTKVTYTMFADPAGAIPPFLVHGSQRTLTKENMLKGIRLTREALRRAADAGAP